MSAEQKPDMAKVTMEMSENFSHENEKVENLTNVQKDVAEALTAEHGSDEWDPAEEKRLRRKIDRRLLWILCIAFPLQAYDKNMLGQAAIFGLRDDLNLNQSQYTMSSAFLYIGYFAGSYPASLLAQLFPADKTAGTIIFHWATCLILTVVCKNFAGIVTQRIFLGFLEGGVSPIFALVTATWYTKSEQAFRMGIWWCSGGYAAFFAPLINYGIGLIEGGALKSWQYMYLVAGVLTLILAAITFFLLPSNPTEARNFTARERYISIARLRENNSGTKNPTWKMAQVKEALTDIRFWLMFFIGTLSMVGNGAFSTMTPIVIQSFGYTALRSMLLTSPTGLVIGTSQLIGSYIASKTTNKRCLMMFIFQIPVLVGAILLWVLPRTRTGPLLFALYCIPFFGGTYNLAIALTIANVSGYTKKTIFASGIFLGYCVGNIVGPLSFVKKDAPNYTAAFAFLACATIGCMLCIAAYAWVCIRDNKKRDATGVMEGFDHAFEDDITDRLNPQFRYIY